MPVVFNEGVHACCISAQDALAVLCQAICLCRGGAVHTQAATEAICFQGNLAKNFTETTRANATVELHLPETLLCVCIALGEVQVFFVLSIDVRHAITVGDDLDSLVQSLQMQGSLLLRKWPS